MRIGILGTGTLARGLARAWTDHDIVIAGRSADKAKKLAEDVGGSAVSPRDAVHGADVVLLAVAWDGVADMLRLAGAPDGSLAGVPLIDPTNAVEHGVGVLLTEGSAAERIAELAPGSLVVKAFHLFAADQWTSGTEVTVAMCGDDRIALDRVAELVRSAGARPAVLGGLARARQLEETAGFVIGLAFGGFNPAAAIPTV